MDKKFVYLAGIKGKFYGLLYSKKEAEAFIKQRKNASYIKVKCNKRLKKITKKDDNELDLYQATPPDKPGSIGILMRNDEVSYFSESFTQYQTELEFTLVNFLKYVKCIKFSNKEKQDMQELIEYVEIVADYQNWYDESYDDLFNEYEISKWFVRHNGPMYPYNDNDYPPDDEFPF